MNENKLAKPPALNEENIVYSGAYMNLEPTTLILGQCIPHDLMDRENHMDDFNL